MSDPGADSVLRFWLGEAAEGAPLTPALVDRWFGADPALDREIRERFAGEIAAACRGERDAWAATPRGRVALVVVLDQFTRNAGRGRDEAFAGDARAQALAREALARDEDTGLPPALRYLLYMPFMHAEDAELQERSVRLFEELAVECAPEERPLFASALAHARDHRDTIARFGRFPARNQALGRRSTPEEKRFLAEHARGVPAPA